MIDFAKHILARRIQRGLNCSNVLTMPFPAGDKKQEEKIIGIAKDKNCMAKTIEVSRSYSCVLIEKINQKELF